MSAVTQAAEAAQGARARILVMCTANRGRSPIAAAMLRRKLAERGLEQSILVESAGLCVHELGRTGMAVPPSIVELAARHGLDVRQHRARPLDWRRYAEFDLAIVMEAWQVEALASAFSSAPPKAYTLRQLAGQALDLDSPDVAGRPMDELERFAAGAERCLEAAFTAGPLARLIAKTANERIAG